ncbi:MAG: hypothetical protein Pg6C_16750 [Treponemataceae bacterium]|nr:MAG: hypothetical protein Pg6C_16750 [Treponemataceae bacterium]
MQGERSIDQYINDQRNGAMIGFVLKKCEAGFFGSLTLKIQGGVIEGIETKDFVTKADVEGCNHAARPRYGRVKDVR